MIYSDNIIENQSIICLMSRSNIGCLHFDWSSRISNITTCVYITVYIAASMSYDGEAKLDFQYSITFVFVST